MKRRTRVASALACLGMATASVALPSTASAQIWGGGGSSGVRSETVRGARGFGGGNVHYPTNATGALPVVAVSPGFTASESTIRWIGPELAEEGMVVITIDTNSRMDQPSSRGQQLNAALNHVISNPPGGVQIDATKLGVVGHSMGGGGTLSAAASNSEIDAVIPLTGWHSDKTWQNVQAAALVVGAQNDAIASVRSHSIPFYDSLGGEKVYIEFRGASHMMPTRSDATLGNYMDAWMNVWLRGDDSGASVVCSNNSSFSDYRSTCPLDGAGGGGTPGGGDGGDGGGSGWPGWGGWGGWGGWWGGLFG